MSKPFTVDQLRFFVRGTNKEHISVHKKKIDAYIAAINLAFEYQDCTFVVVKSVNWQEEQLFSFKIGMQLKFSEIKDIMTAFLQVLQNKTKKINYWS